MCVVAVAVGGVLDIIAISVAVSRVQGLLDAGLCTRNLCVQKS